MIHLWTEQGKKLYVNRYCGNIENFAHTQI